MGMIMRMGTAIMMATTTMTAMATRMSTRTRIMKAMMITTSTAIMMIMAILTSGPKSRICTFGWRPTNAEVMATAIAERLAEVDPGNAATYRANAAAFGERMHALEDRLSSMLKPAAGKPFIVFHDAWQHFEKQFGLTAVGSITISAEQRPGARHISRLRSKISDLGAVCVFSEPQFDGRLVDTLAHGSDARKAEADPLGDLGAKPGIGYYETSMTKAAEAFRDCLVN